MASVLASLTIREQAADEAAVTLAAFVRAAIRAADAAGEPFVMLEGDPGLYARWGFEPAAAHGLTPPSVRVPAPACQVVVLASWDPDTTGSLVYNDVFWTHDAVGLRGAALAAVRAALGDASSGGPVTTDRAADP